MRNRHRNARSAEPETSYDQIMSKPRLLAAGSSILEVPPEEMFFVLRYMQISEY